MIGLIASSPMGKEVKKMITWMEMLVSNNTLVMTGIVDRYSCTRDTDIPSKLCNKMYVCALLLVCHPLDSNHDINPTVLFAFIPR